MSNERLFVAASVLAFVLLGLTSVGCGEMEGSVTSPTTTVGTPEQTQGSTVSILD